MSRICALTGSHGAKAQPSGTVHSRAKRRRGLASEPVLPGEALFGRWRGEKGEGGLRDCPQPRAAARWTADSLHHCRACHLCRVGEPSASLCGRPVLVMWEPPYKGPPPFASWPHLLQFFLGALPWLLPPPGTLLP